MTVVWSILVHLWWTARILGDGIIVVWAFRYWREHYDRKPQKMVDPPGMVNGRMHDVQAQPNGDLLHFSTCWCRRD